MDASRLCNSLTLQMSAASSAGRRSNSSNVACRAHQARMGRPAAANFYQVLALEPENAGADAVKRAYRSLALRHHPDVCPPSGKEEATRTFVEIQRAYEILSDPVLREEYDHQLGLVGSAKQTNQRDEERRRVYPKQVWIEQLRELKSRSMSRMGKKKMDYL
ncbi:hypothetical protein OPV22_016847 [Ensete ventricosum]|uniref:J domain-containing protein n=1 Tax=Ensete ventricosum TaxID=4639 RepID=A0AAV8QZM7_ENSVE|nr:hypothetical protein OPV22_016847 [Ensete ventricosum]